MSSEDLSHLAPLIAELSPEEQAALPARLRALGADDATKAWNAAKAKREEAIAAARAKVDPDDPESEYVIADVDERNALIKAAKDEWAEFKAGAIAEQEG